MEPPQHVSEMAQVSGEYLCALRNSVMHLNLFLDEAIDAALREAQTAAWYPLDQLHTMLAALAATYVKPGPILEQIGVRASHELQQFSAFRPWFENGLTFLNAHRHGHFFKQLIRGSDQVTGSLSLRTLNAHTGMATIHSTTPFSRDFERGFLRGGIQASGRDIVTGIEQTPNVNTFRMTCIFANVAGTERSSSVHLPPVLARRYQALEDEVERQQTFAKAVSQTLSDTLRHPRVRTLPLPESAPDRMMDVLFDATITINEASRIVAFSSGAEQLFGYPSHEAIGQPVDELIIPPHLRQRHRDGLARCLATGQTRVLGRRLEIEAMHADGHIVPIEMAVQEVRLASQRGFTAYLRDITERERMERALRESEQRFRSMAEANPVPMGIVGVADLRWLYVSPSLAALIGLPVTELLGMPVEAFRRRNTSGKEGEWFARLMDEGAIDACELTLYKPDGSMIPIALTAKRIVYEGADAILGGIMDLTERKRTEEEMARQQESITPERKAQCLRHPPSRSGSRTQQPALRGHGTGDHLGRRDRRSANGHRHRENTAGSRALYTDRPDLFGYRASTAARAQIS
ncbi:MAG: hypothetical protein ETSY1_20415 [Candidatus Entotheonella factor]|uniref:Histidine kinase n=1 Tax=Entotheonella factor TaxID=1429438 RepID=W4LJ69_ENTF1|nr:MAG: hypothetical protein ETSY1_20415 [Candidatus Entotheonella factor]